MYQLLVAVATVRRVLAPSHMTPKVCSSVPVPPSQAVGEVGQLLFLQQQSKIRSSAEEWAPELHDCLHGVGEVSPTGPCGGLQKASGHVPPACSLSPHLPFPAPSCRQQTLQGTPRPTGSLFSDFVLFLLDGFPAYQALSGEEGSLGVAGPSPTALSISRQVVQPCVSVQQ